MKRIVVACDGTWSRPDQLRGGTVAPSNVALLALGVAATAPDGTEQRVLYQTGVGTRRHERLWGGLLGFGLSRNIRECYRWLVRTYEPGDELYLMGFSRGAFTARSLAGLVRQAGILRPEHEDRIGDAYRLYRARGDDAKPNGLESRLFRRSWSYPEGGIWCVGVWDTVGSLGIPTFGLVVPWLSRWWSFHDTELSSRVRHAFQALAIDERRRPFRPTLWTLPEPEPGQVLEQVWFPGVHSDVGGGLPGRGLSDLTLTWMAHRVAGAGLALEPGFLEGLGGDPTAAMHASRTGLYRLLPEYVRPLAGDGVAVSDAALERRAADPGYRPPNLEAYLS